jgi:hypothetical protein
MWEEDTCGPCPQREGGNGVRPLYAALIIIGMLLLIALLVGIVLTTFKFLLWVGITGLVIWGIYALVTRPWRHG